MVPPQTTLEVRRWWLLKLLAVALETVVAGKFEAAIDLAEPTAG